MRFTTRITGLLVAVLFATATFAQSMAGKNSIQGVWKITEVVVGNDGRHVHNPTSIWIFTGKYFSQVNEQNEETRPDAPIPLASATADQLREALGPFGANSGTYEIKGSEVTLHRLVSNYPQLMKSGNYLAYTFKIEGDTLTMVQKADQNGPIKNPNTVKLTRIE